MKKNILITAILLIYTCTFVFLFVRLRSMSVAVLDELSERNIYYILGFMFIAGISGTLYLILDANNKKFALSNGMESESISFDNNNTRVENTQESRKASNLEGIKSDLESILRNEGSLPEKLDKVLWKMSQYFEISQALVYLQEQKQWTLQSSYAYVVNENDSRFILSGEGLAGQAAKDGKPYFIKEIPEGYLKVTSGLGESFPLSLLIVPCSEHNEVKAIFELSSLKDYSKQTFDEIVSVCNHVSALINQ